ncbi:MAG: putative Transglycosylase [Frankiales bacterium]|nr:putative Transglycosylase [Frankiales bacterium]
MRWLRRVVIFAVSVVVALGLVVAVAWPLTPSVADAESRIATRLAAHGATDPHALPVPDRVGEAIIATEDSRFRSHWGIDALGVVRAALNFSNGAQDAGGATLDQQQAKNLWTGDGGLLVKAQQVELAFKLESMYSKDQILEMYLAEVYFGHGFYGLPAAARGYFGVAPASLTWAQASMLAGLVQAPSAYDPYHHLDLAKSRQRHVLDRLVATSRLTAAQADTAFAAPLGLR